MLLVDTNVLIDVLEDDPRWVDWSIDMLRRQSQVHRLTINPIIYAELSLTFSTVEALDEAVADFGVEVAEVPRPALFLAGKAFVAYRRSGGSATTYWPTSSSARMPRSKAGPSLHEIRASTGGIFPRSNL